MLENLRIFLSKYNTSEPHYFWLYFKTLGGYNSGGVAYVFSNKTLKDFYGLLKDPQNCTPKNPFEEVALRACLKNVPIKTIPGDTRDEYQKETFYLLKPIHHFNLPAKNWLCEYDKWENRDGKDSCSDDSISFHYISNKDMYIINYLIYDLKTGDEML